MMKEQLTIHIYTNHHIDELHSFIFVFSQLLDWDLVGSDDLIGETKVPTR